MRTITALPEFPFRIFAVDPGKDTGLSRTRVEQDKFSVEETRVVRYIPENLQTPVNDLAEWASTCSGTRNAVLVENFHVRPNQKSVNTTAINVITEIQRWLDEYPRGVDFLIFREPVSGKFGISNEVLGRMGLRERGGLTRHSNDAIRHTMSWLAKRGYLPVCNSAWPRE